LSRSFESLMMTAFAVGFANTLYYVGLTTVLMEYTPADLIGRVASSRQAAIGLVRIVSPLVFGAVADRIGIRNSVVAMASVGAIGTAVVAIASPSIRRFDVGVSSITERVYGRLARLTGEVSAEFEPSQQRWLSLFSLAVVLVAWLGLYHRAPMQAVGVLVAVLILTHVGSVVHRRKWLQGGGASNSSPVTAPRRQDYPFE